MATITLKLNRVEAEALATMLADEMLKMRERARDAECRGEDFARRWCHERADLASAILTRTANAVHHPNGVDENDS